MSDLLLRNPIVMITGRPYGTETKQTACTCTKLGSPVSNIPILECMKTLQKNCNSVDLIIFLHPQSYVLLYSAGQNMLSHFQYDDIISIDFMHVRTHVPIDIDCHRS